MKSIRIRITSFTLGVVLLLGSGCTDILEEKPRHILTPAYFETSEGIQAGITAAYAYLRFVYGSEIYLFLTNHGVDEHTPGTEGAYGWIINDYEFDAATGQFQLVWNRAYQAINTCNGVIEFAPKSDLSDELKKQYMAEAKFLRAHWHFKLVQMYGDITLRLEFNKSPSNIASRTPKAEVYTTIVDDLVFAAENLPVTATQFGRATQKAALHLLAKVYLTRAQSTDQLGTQDLQDALNTAKLLIDNQAAHGAALLEDFADVHREGNEDNEEVLMTIQRTEDPLFFRQDEHDAEDKSCFVFHPHYIQARGLIRTLEYGRGWARMKPSIYTLTVAFAERVNDSRYDNTYRTLWLGNAPEQLWSMSDTVETVWGFKIDANIVRAKVDAGEPRIPIGDTALWMPGNNMTRDEIYNKTIARGKYYTILPQGYYTTPENYVNLSDPNVTDYSGWLFPGIKKFDDTTREHINNPANRPHIMFRLAETYLIAAEAAFLLQQNDVAATYLNAVRRRAAFRAGNTPAQNEAAALAMEISAGSVTMDFILEERTRELIGEHTRFHDLVRTNTLLDRVARYNTRAAEGILPHHVLRPIPQSQIDLCVDPTQPDGKYPQNPGYN